MKKRREITEQGFDKQAEELRKWITDSVSPFENDTPAKKAARIEAARNDLLAFCKIYLPHYFFTDFGEFHNEWRDITELRDCLALVGAPREHAKSTFFTLAVPLRNICFQLRRFQLILSDTNDQATAFTLAIREEIAHNPRIKHDFGDLKGSKWAEGRFVANDCLTLARGAGEKVRGLKHRQFRPDYAAGDDLENDESVRSPKRVAQTLDWLKGAVLGSMGSGYLFVMVGNLFNPKSVLSQLIAERDEETGEKLHRSHVYTAILDEGKSTERPLWPANWSMERLKRKRRTLGPRAFNKEMMNKVVVEDNAFQERHKRYYEIEELNNKRLVTGSAADPSSTSHSGSDPKAIVTGSLDTVNMIFYVRRAWIRRASNGQMFDEAYRQHDEFGGAVSIEENSLKDFLHDAIASYARERQRYIPWRAIQHSTNKMARIEGTLQYLWEQGKLRFLKGDSDQETLIEQLIYLEDANTPDDGADALETVVSALQKSANGSAEIETGPERGVYGSTGWGGALRDHGTHGAYR